MAVLVTAFSLLLVAEPFGNRVTVVVDDYLCWLVPALAGVLCVARARTARLSETSGPWLGWALLGTSCMSWAAGGLAWTVYEVHLGREVPFPSLADAGYLVAVPFAVSGVTLLAGGRGGLRVRLRDVADGAVAGTALLFVSWATVLGPVFRDGEGSLLARSIGLAYPVGDVVVATAALMAVARARGAYRYVLTLIGLGLGSVAVSDTSFAWFTAQGEYVTGNLFDVGYVLGYALVALAALHPSAPDGQPGPPDSDVVQAADASGTDCADEDGDFTRLTTLLPYAPVVLTGLVGIGLDLPSRPLGAFLFWDAMAMLAILLARQLLNVSANQVLSERLKAIVAALEARERELAFRAYHDDLTGLPNRARFYQVLARRGAESGRQGHDDSVTVLLIDLDDFKRVNDTYGHHVGDALLVEAAARLRGAATGTELVARLGGDEFAVIAFGIADRAAAEALTQRFAEHLADPLQLPGATLTINASIGVAGPDSRPDAESLLLEADQAMYRAKRRRRAAAPV